MAGFSSLLSLLGLGLGLYQSQQQTKAADRATNQARESALAQEARAKDTAKKSEEAQNRANQKRPDVAGILSAATQSGKAGASGTLLTGPAGVNPGDLLLGKSSLLGQ